MARAGRPVCNHGAAVAVAGKAEAAFDHLRAASKYFVAAGCAIIISSSTQDLIGIDVRLEEPFHIGIRSIFDRPKQRHLLSGGQVTGPAALQLGRGALDLMEVDYVDDPHLGAKNVMHLQFLKVREHHITGERGGDKAGSWRRKLMIGPRWISSEDFDWWIAFVANEPAEVVNNDPPIVVSPNAYTYTAVLINHRTHVARKQLLRAPTLPAKCNARMLTVEIATLDRAL
jgi:hypothetical protein